MENFPPSSCAETTPSPVVILVAEDDASVRAFVCTVLEEAGYFVLPACDGEDAVRISQAFPGSIHALVSDIHMPRLDGFALREQILRLRPGIKVLLMSGLASRAADGVVVLQKPFELEIFTQHVQALLERLDEAVS